MATFTPQDYRDLFGLNARLDRRRFFLSPRECELVQSAIASPKEQAWILASVVWLKSENSLTSILTKGIVDRINAAIRTWDFRISSHTTSLAGAVEYSPTEHLDPATATTFLRLCLEQPADSSIGCRAVRIAASNALGRLHRRNVPGAADVLTDHLDDPDASIANNAKAYLKNQ